MTLKEQIAAWLAIFCPPGQWTEIRALGPARSAFGDNPMELAGKALDYEANAVGVYFTPNRLVAGIEGAAKDADVERRTWLLVDVDPVRPADTPATDAERSAAWTVLHRCKAALEAAGLRGHVIGDSGNGFHLCYPIDLPNDEQSRDLCRAVLAGLHDRCSDDAALVDKSTFNAARIWKLYGTLAKKGQATAERPHRRSRVVETGAFEHYTAESNTTHIAELVAAWKSQEETRRPSGSSDRYAEAALSRELAELANAKPGDRNNALNRSAFAMGQLVAGGALSSQAVESALLGMAMSIGLEAKEARRTIASGMMAGAREPRGVPGETAGHGVGHAGVPPTPTTEPAFPMPIPASQLKEGNPQSWLWEGYIGRESITLFSALWKAGKTTMLVHLIRAMETGGEFCGKKLAGGKVLYVTEESESRWAKRRNQSMIADHVEFIVRPFKNKPKQDQWEGFIAHVCRLAKDRRYDLVIFDPLTNLWPVVEENDAGRVSQAILPMHHMTDHSSVLLVHHSRKSDGQEATSSRGSGALAAFVDTIMELRRYDAGSSDDRRRVIKAYGRDEDTQDELVVELNEMDGYTAHGSRKVIRADEITTQILRILPTRQPGMTVTDIIEMWDGTPPRRKSILDALREGANKLWSRQGDGTKGNPFTYWTAPPE